MAQMSREDPIELDIPDGVAGAEQSVEVLRAWIADGSLMVSLNADAFGDRVADWGRLLAEIAHHVAKASELNGHMAYHEGLQAIDQGFDQFLSMGQPTMSGKLRGRKSH
jgi:hypothetical protein